MKKFLFLIIIVGGLYHFKPELFQSLQLPKWVTSNGAYDQEGNPAVFVFTSLACGDSCKKTINELKRRKAPYTEFPLDNNEKNIALYRKLGSGGLPYIVCGEEKISGFHKATIVSALAETYGHRFLTRLEKKYFNRHFYKDGSPKVIMYGVNWCPYCRKMREEFKNRHIDYIEINVEGSVERHTITQTMGIRGYPLIYVGYQRIRRSTIDNVLNVIQSNGRHRS